MATGVPADSGLVLGPGGLSDPRPSYRGDDTKKPTLFSTLCSRGHVLARRVRGSPRPGCQEHTGPTARKDSGAHIKGARGGEQHSRHIGGGSWRGRRSEKPCFRVEVRRARGGPVRGAPISRDLVRFTPGAPRHSPPEGRIPRTVPAKAHRIARGDADRGPARGRRSI